MSVLSAVIVNTFIQVLSTECYTVISHAGTNEQR